MKRVIITGATGFIGRQALKHVDRKNFEIHCVTTKNVKSGNQGIIWHTADLLNAQECNDLFNAVNPTHLLHFAWYTEPGKYPVSEKNIDWLNASLLMLKHFGRCNGERVTFAGTCFEYDLQYGFCSENVTPDRPKTMYGICKNSLRQVSESFCAQNDISFSWGRIFFLYGPHEPPSRLVPSVIISLLKDEQAKVSHGKQIRDFLHSEDVASAMVALLESDVKGIVNIGSGVPVSIKDVVHKISVMLGRTELVRFGTIPTPEEDPPLIVADVRRLTEEVGWKPRYNLDNGLDKTIEWWKENVK
jgi:nucleoside-diphosphate-sugar epimerase